MMSVVKAMSSIRTGSGEAGGEHRLFDWLVGLLIWSGTPVQSVGGSDPSQRKPGDRRRK
jgi:hypothetical protein